MAMDPEELGRKVLLGEIKSPGGYGSTNGLYNMKLNPEHINIAQEIDRKFTKLEGKQDNWLRKVRPIVVG